MWHGTKKYDPRLVAVSNDGFSTQFAQDNCSWGRAVYFAVNASYSCGSNRNNGYSHHLPNGATLSDGSTVPMEPNWSYLQKSKWEGNLLLARITPLENLLKVMIL